MYRLCIFDLDGTLLNTVYALTYVTNLTLDAFGLRHVTPEETKRIVGNGYRMQMKRALVLAGDEKLVHYEASLPIYMENFSKYCLKDVEPYDGIRELLASLKEMGVHVAVLSNKPHDQAIVNIETFFGKGYFDVVRGEQAGTPKKPAPDGAFAICRELGIKQEECLYLGDTNTDMETGLNAGMDTVGVLWGFRDREELEGCHPQYIVAHPSEVAEIVKKKNESHGRMESCLCLFIALKRETVVKENDI